MARIKLTDFTNEAASKISGEQLRAILEDLVLKNEDIIVDFAGITRFASPFFNNSFSALSIQHGFEAIRKIRLENLSEIGKETYETSIDNAKLLCENPKYKDEIEDIISAAPKKVEC